MSQSGSSGESGTGITLTQIFAGGFALVLATAAGTFTVMRFAVEHSDKQPTFNPHTATSAQATEEEQFIHDQLRLISKILNDSGLKHTIMDQAIRVTFASDSSSGGIALHMVPRFNSRQVQVVVATRVIVDEAKRAKALEWVNGQNRQLIYGRYFIDKDGEFMLDWSFRTSDEGVPPTPVKVALHAMAGTIDEDLSAMKELGHARPADD